MPMIGINYLAVVAAALATFVVGALWYGPLFGKKWMQLHGYTPEQLAEMQKGMGKTYGLSLVAYLVMAVVLSILVSYTGVANAGEGAWLGFLCWVGFAATIGLTANLFSDKSFGTYVLDAGYQLVYLVLMSVILSVWR